MPIGFRIGLAVLFLAAGCPKESADPELALEVTVSLSGECPGVPSIAVVRAAEATICYRAGNLSSEPVESVLITDGTARFDLGTLPARKLVYRSRAVTVTTQLQSGIRSVNRVVAVSPRSA